MFSIVLTAFICGIGICMVIAARKDLRSDKAQHHSVKAKLSAVLVIMCAAAMVVCIVAYALTNIGSVAEFVGNPTENSGLTAERGTMSFSLGPWLAEASQKPNARPERLLEPGGMQSQQSTDGSVLGLHSCRALSPEPRDKIARRRWKNTGLRFIQSFDESIELIKPEDQRCSCKLRPF
jgi:hypothetical protein